MSEASEVPMPQPTPLDEENAMKLMHLVEDASLKGKPYGDEHCRSCLYYLDSDADFTYCWHPKVRILVDEDWWCQWWEEREEE
jgi:hypothetical protein